MHNFNLICMLALIRKSSLKLRYDYSRSKRGPLLFKKSVLSIMYRESNVTQHLGK